MHKIEDKLSQTRSNIRAHAQSAGRKFEDILLLAVSKKQNIDAISAAYLAGQHAFGENYLQEALEKIKSLSHLDVQWHFIGNLQSNKARQVAENFSWVHTVDKLKTAQKLSQHRPENLPPLQVCIQVNIDREENKSGIYEEDLVTLADAIHNLPRLTLRGLMAIPDKKLINAPHQRLNNLINMLNAKHPHLQMDTLSMGMSADLKPAISAGATIVRVGTGIFGERAE